MPSQTTKPDTGCTVTDICIEHGLLREALEAAMPLLAYLASDCDADVDFDRTLGPQMPAIYAQAKAALEATR